MTSTHAMIDHPSDWTGSQWLLNQAIRDDQAGKMGHFSSPGGALTRLKNSTHLTCILTNKSRSRRRMSLLHEVAHELR